MPGDEIAPTELLSLTEYVQVLVDLIRANGNYCEEVFHRMLRKRCPDGFFQSTQFEKARSQLIQLGLLTKTISGYYPIHLVAVNSLDPTVLDSMLTYLDKSNWNGWLCKDQNFKNMSVSLASRDRDVLLRRYFLSKQESLRSIAGHYGVTRERIRQIEKRVLLKLRNRGLNIVFLSALLRLQVFNILKIEQLSTVNTFLEVHSENPLCLLMMVRKISNLDFALLGKTLVYIQYKGHPQISELNVNRWMDQVEIPGSEFWAYLIERGFGFLKEPEANVLHGYFQGVHQSKASLKNLIARSLVLIGCPAHYSDIASKVREIATEKYSNCNDYNVQAALGRYPEFVWVGKRGIYGLKKWGLSPPDKSLERQIHEILEKASQPLPKEMISAELSKKRPYFSQTSLQLLLGMSSKIAKVPDGRYRLINENEMRAERMEKVRAGQMSKAMEKTFNGWSESR